MIKITVAGKEICFNLKNWETERSLFQYWYAVSDMPKYKEKKLKITTDANEHLLYMIGEIENCLFIEETYIRPENTEPVVEKCEKKEESRIEELFDKYFPVKSDISNEIKKIFCKAFNELKVTKIDKIFHFCAEVRTLGYIIDHQDPTVTQIISELVQGPDDEDIQPYVNRYIEYAKRKKFS